MNNHKYSYNYYWYFVGGTISLLYIWTILSAALILGGIIRLLKGGIANPLELMFQIIVLFASTIFLLRAISIYINLYPEIIITEDGIRIRIFKLWLIWLFVSWDQLLEIQKSPRNLDGYDYLVITVGKDLTKFHDYLSAKWGTGVGNQIILKESLLGRDELISRISKRIKIIDRLN